MVDDIDILNMQINFAESIITTARMTDAIGNILIEKGITTQEEINEKASILKNAKEYKEALDMIENQKELLAKRMEQKKSMKNLFGPDPFDGVKFG